MNKTETLYLRILRASIILVAGLSLTTAVISFLVAGYKWQLDDPDLPWEDASENIAPRFKAENLFKNILSDKPALYASFKSSFGLKKDGKLLYHPVEIDIDDVGIALGDLTNAKFIEFAQSAFGVLPNNHVSEYLFGDEAQEVSWSSALTTDDDRDLSNLNNLWKALMSYYINDSERIARVIGAMPDTERQELQTALFGYVRSGTNTPVYLSAANDEFLSVLEEYGNAYEADQLAVEIERLEAIPAIMVAAAAFGSFLLIMFIFLAVAIESNLRLINKSIQQLDH